jgi:hypothetical protein
MAGECGDDSRQIPQRVWAKKQTAAFRLAFIRLYGCAWLFDLPERPRTHRPRRSAYVCRRNNALMLRMETDAITPLRPGEEPH